LKPMITKLTTRDIARGFAETLNCVAYGRERFMITRRGRPMAVLISPTEFGQLEQLERARAKDAR
jgi:prevent-host-death family protein